MKTAPQQPKASRFLLLLLLLATLTTGGAAQAKKVNVVASVPDLGEMARRLLSRLQRGAERGRREA